MKRFGIALLALLMAALPFSQVKAESILLNGQKQYYTVQLRTDKQAIVYARIIFTNGSADTNLDSYQFSLPEGMSIANLSVQQVLAKPTNKQCKTYETIDQWRDRMSKYMTFAPVNDNDYEGSKQCIEYNTSALYNDDYDYDKDMGSSTNYYYYGYYQTRQVNFDYSDLKTDVNNGTYIVKLSEAVKPKKQGSILVSFTTKDFVGSGVLGRYDYKVRTLLAKQMIDRSVVAVNFDTNMYSRQAKQERTYDSATSASTAMMGASANYQSNSMDDLRMNVGSGGIYTKTQEALLPGDVLTVTGVFATNPLMLFSTELVITLLVLAAAIIGSLWFLKKWRKKHPKQLKATKDLGSIPTQAINGGDVSASSSVQWKHNIITSVLSIVGTIIVCCIIGGAMSQLSSSSSFISGFVVVGIIIIAVFGAIIIPSFYILRFGYKNAFIWSLVHLATVFVGLLLVISIVSMLTGNPSGPSMLD